MCRIIVMLLLSCLTTIKAQSECAQCMCIPKNGSILANCSNVQDNFHILPTDFLKSLGPKVEYLTMDKVSFNQLPSNIFVAAKLESLQEISINECATEIIDKEAFKKLNKLKILSANFNKINRLDRATFQDTINLEELYFGHNNLSVLEDGLLSNLKSLKIVSFQNNHITKIGNHIFINNLNLNNIDLQQNDISYINGSMMQALTNLKTYAVHDNPWKCHCDLYDFHKFTMEVKPSIFPTCNATSNPEKIRNRPWSDLVKEDFTCKPNISIWTVIDTEENLVLYCKIRTSPLINGVLFRDSNNYVRRSRINSTTEDYTYFYTLPIGNIYEAQRHTYACNSSNDFGRTEKKLNFKITLQYLRHFNGEPRFSCGNHSNVKWYSNNTIINPNNKFQTLQNPKQDTWYKCVHSEDEEEYFIVPIVNSTGEADLPTYIIVIFVALLAILIFLIILVIIRHKKRRDEEVEAINETLRMSSMRDYVYDKGE